jgi:hypothetical protein
LVEDKISIDKVLPASGIPMALTATIPSADQAASAPGPTDDEDERQPLLPSFKPPSYHEQLEVPAPSVELLNNPDPECSECLQTTDLDAKARPRAWTILRVLVGLLITSLLAILVRQLIADSDVDVSSL